MASHDETLAALETAFGPLTEAGDVDVTADDNGDIEVIADAWTFHAEGWPGPSLAWLAHDDEPEQHDAESLRAEVQPAVLAALTEVNETLGGALRQALIASDDPLSTGLAMVLSSDSDPAT
jgi:hypothetical protein